MDKPNRKSIKITAKGGKVFVNGKQVKSSGKARPRIMVKQAITKDEFLANLAKVCRPIKSTESDSEKTQT